MECFIKNDDQDHDNKLSDEMIKTRKKCVNNDDSKNRIDNHKGKLTLTLQHLQTELSLQGSTTEKLVCRWSSVEFEDESSPSGTNCDDSRGIANEKAKTETHRLFMD